MKPLLLLATNSKLKRTQQVLHYSQRLPYTFFDEKLFSKKHKNYNSISYKISFKVDAYFISFVLLANLKKTGQSNEMHFVSGCQVTEQCWQI